jgi:localization factor PodJL
MSGTPWSVKGIDPKAREVAKDLARRSGMTLGEWLNRMILEDEGPEDVASESYFTDPRERPDRGHVEPSYEARPFVERPIRTYYETARAPEPPIRPEPLRPSPSRYEAPEHPADEIGRVALALERLTDRIESTEARTGLAISGVEHSVREAVARIEQAEREHVAVAARFEGVAGETQSEQGRLAERLRRMEQEAAGPRSAEALRALEQALGKVAGHLYDGENRTRETLAVLRRRIEEAESRGAAPAGEVMDEVVSRVGARLGEAEGRTSEALEGLKSSFAALDGRLRSVEGAASPDLEQRLEALTSGLGTRLDAVRNEIAKSLEVAAEGRFDRMERKLGEMGEQVRLAEQHSAQVLERMGREVLTVAEGLNRRIGQTETRSADAIEQVGGEVARIAQVVESKLSRNDQVQAEALEKLGVEIGKISERLAERIGAAERRSAQAIDDVGEQVTRVTERLNQRSERASEDLAERIRLSEERTGRLLEEAREKIDLRLAEAQRRLSEEMAAAGPARAAPAHEDAEDDFSPAAPFPSFQPLDSGPGASSGSLYGGGSPSRDAFLPEPEAEEPSVFARPTFEAAAHQAPTAFAPTPFPSEAERPAFDAEDFEAADGFAPLSEDLDENSLIEDELALPLQAEPTGHVEPAKAPAHAEPVLPPTPIFTPSAIFPPPPAVAAPVAETLGQAFDFDAPPLPPTPAEQEAAREPGQPLSTREVIEQARAAARAAAQNDKGQKAREAKPKTERTGMLFGGFASSRPKRRAGSSLQTALLVVGGAAFFSVGAAGVVLMEAKPGGHPPKRVAQALAALSSGKSGEITAAEPDTAPFPGRAPRVAMALTPQPIVPIAVAPPAAPDLSDRFDKAIQAVEANRPGGVEELRKVAELGSAPAQFYLAKLYEVGERGVKKDLAESRRWTERAAEGGDRKAMHNLGIAYISGVGGPKNSTTAAQWFRRAADLGLVDSQYNLAALYEQGLGVSQNPAEAYKWYLIAARTGDADARKRAEQLKTNLTPDARIVAERTATGFHPTQANPSTLIAKAGGVAEPQAPLANMVTAQKALSRLGYYQGPTDGSASPALKFAIAAYQRDQGAAATGILDPATVQRLSVFTR